MSETYAHLFRVPMTGLRFFTVYGPWGRPDMAMWIFTSKILAGQPIPVFNHGRMQRDFTYIDDIVSGVIGCLDHPPADDGAPKAGGSRAPHRLYNIGNNAPEELMRLIAVLEQAIGRKAQIDFQPMQPGDVHATFADISAIQRDIGFAPTTGIAEGVPRFVAWYRDYHG
jgi:UDP-glucuronate 4-epimerase